MLSRLERILALAPLSVLVGACAPSSPGKPTPVDQTKIHSLPSGPLEMIYEQIAAAELESSFFVYDCDLRLEATKKRLTRFVDQNIKSLSNARHSQAAGSSTQSDGSLSERASGSSFKLGSLSVQERVRFDPNGPEWNTHTSPSWEQLDTYRGYVEALIASGDHATARVFLKEMDRRIRGLAADEERRRVHKLSYRIDPQTFGDFKDLLRGVKSCVDDSSCLPADLLSRLESGAKALISETHTYSKMNEWMNEATDAADARERMKTFSEWIQNDVDYYSARKTQAVRRLGPGRFEVALNAGPLRELETQIANFIAELWSGSGRSLEITWAPGRFPEGVLFPYSFSLMEEQEGRAYVSHIAKEIVLPTTLRYATIHHEIGHVLGLPDSYYTSFDTKTCTYTQHSRAMDVMSSSDSGEVLDSHWSELDVLYAP